MTECNVIVFNKRRASYIPLINEILEHSDSMECSLDVNKRRASLYYL